PLLGLGSEMCIIDITKTEATTTNTEATTTTTEATTTTTEATTTTTEATITEESTIPTGENNNNNKEIVLTDVAYNTSYSLSDYDYNAIEKIILKLDGNVGYGFGGKVVFGNWIEQLDYSASDLTDEYTIEFNVTNPQDVLTIYNYWGDMALESVTLIMTDSAPSDSTTTPAEDNNNNNKEVVLTDIAYNTSYLLNDYDYNAIEKIVLKLNGNVGYGFGGKIVFGNWTEQIDYSASDLTDEYTIELDVTNPQDMLTIYSYWGDMVLENVTLIMK
ncbi:MAG: hypothetical protein K2O52_07250, partial [Oscillospiraceae bacterium]|nr:hypothetical protein [Oscillospiraceae bacterium]